MLKQALIAFTLGFSLERLFTCPLLAMSLSMSDKWGGLKFILGRIFGILVLGLVAAALSANLDIPFRLLDGVFGVLLVAMGIGVIMDANKGRHAPKRIARASFGLGLFRGLLNPGRKIVYLFPLLMGANPVEGVIIALFYALGSSILLVVGFVSGEALNRLFAKQRLFSYAGGLILIGLGLYYLVKIF